jgi:hypothetical protein
MTVPYLDAAVRFLVQKIFECVVLALMELYSQWTLWVDADPPKSFAEQDLAKFLRKLGSFATIAVSSFLSARAY